MGCALTDQHCKAQNALLILTMSSLSAFLHKYATKKSCCWSTPKPSVTNQTCLTWTQNPHSTNSHNSAQKCPFLTSIKSILPHHVCWDIKPGVRLAEWSLYQHRTYLLAEYISIHDTYSFICIALFLTPQQFIITRTHLPIGSHKHQHWLECRAQGHFVIGIEPSRSWTTHSTSNLHKYEHSRYT